MSGSPQRPVLLRAAGFAVVGVAGFLVDAGVLSQVAGVFGPYGGRAISFLCAVATTFILNRAFVFSGGRDRPLHQQAAMFFAANAVGMSINLSVYALLVFLGVPPLAGVAVGSVAGGVSNFLAADRLVFRDRRRR